MRLGPHPHPTPTHTWLEEDLCAPHLVLALWHLEHSQQLLDCSTCLLLTGQHNVLLLTRQQDLVARHKVTMPASRQQSKAGRRAAR